MKFPYASQPISVNSMTLCSRLVMPPMATEQSSSGQVTDQLCAYYRRRVQNIGLVITEHAYISPEGKASPRQLSISQDEDIAGLKRLVNTIHAASDAKVFSQLNHAGLAAGYTVKGQSDINRVIQCFVEAAVRSQKAGYDGVEIHSAHGYLLNQFYSPTVNHRTDSYSAVSIENRTRLHVQVIRAVRTAVGDSYPIALRFGAADYPLQNGAIQDAQKAAQIFEEAGIDLLDISGGISGFRNPFSTAPGYFAELSRPIKEVVRIPVILTGGVRTVQEAENLLAGGAADMIGIGRALMRDPDCVSRAFDVES